MEPLTLMALMSAAGLLKSELVDRPRQKRQANLAAEITRWSPWTGMKADRVQESDPFGQALQFGATGASMAQGLQRGEMENKLLDAQTGYYNRGGEGSGANVTQPRYWGMRSVPELTGESMSGPSAEKEDTIKKLLGLSNWTGTGRGY